jgi:hypothetical protein
MSYQWDKEKAKLNRVKHGIFFSDAVAVFSDAHAITIENGHQDEQRFITIGMDAFGRVLVVIYTWREDEIRIISARLATPKEHKQYEAKR